MLSLVRLSISLQVLGGILLHKCQGHLMDKHNSPRPCCKLKPAALTPLKKYAFIDCACSSLK